MQGDENSSIGHPARSPEGGLSCAVQWRDTLRGLASELSAQLSTDDLRALFRAVGRRVARGVPIQANTIEELVESVNQYLKTVGWGEMRAQDFGEAYEFVHSGAPLRDAFGGSALIWSSAILEGLYAEWLKLLGAGDGLSVFQVGQSEGELDTLRFRLARSSAFA